MALDIQTIAMTGSYVPYERPPQPYTLWTAIPRGLQSFIVAFEQVDAKALNDEALLQLTATLPPNFGYVMMDAMVSLTNNQALDWSDEVLLNLQNFYRAEVPLSVALTINWVHAFPLITQNRQARTLDGEKPWPSFPIIGTQGTSGAQINISMFNNVATASPVGIVNAYIAFWQFDLEQIRKFAINSPQPVHPR